MQRTEFGEEQKHSRRKMEVDYLWKAIFRPFEGDKNLPKDEGEAGVAQPLKNTKHCLQDFAKQLGFLFCFVVFVLLSLAGSNQDVQRTLFLLAKLRTSLWIKNFLALPCLWLSLKGFGGKPEREPVSSVICININILLKQGAWQWLTGLNNVRLRLCLKTK